MRVRFEGLPQDSVVSTHETPVGRLSLVASTEGLHCVLWPEDGSCSHLRQGDDHPVILQTKAQLDLYFAGQLDEFSLPLAPLGTPFQRAVWAELSKIPYGATVTYLEQAQGLGDPKKCRAVGAANGRNPLSIVVPCHRVVGANGALTGFAGGLEAKKALLDLEKTKNL